MSSFKINGVDIISPVSCSYQLSDLSTEESGRSTRDGAMSKDIIAQKRTLTFGWQNLTWTAATKLSSMCKNQGVVLLLTYPDIMTGKFVTGRFYTGDFSASYRINSISDIMVTDIECSFIEM